MANAQYAILRFAKYKGPEISGIEAHNERTKEKYASNPDIDPSRTHLNFHLTLKKLQEAKLQQDYADACAILDRIPPEIIREYTNRSTKKQEVRHYR